MSYRWFMVLAALCVAGPVSARYAMAGMVDPRASAPTAWACGESLKVSPTQAPQATNTTWSADGNRVRLYGGRQEYVGFQVVVNAGAAPLSGVQVRMGRLRSAGGRELSAGNVDLFLEHYVRVTVPSQNGNGDPVPEAKAGEFPVQMVPLRDPQPGARFDVPAGRNQPVWVDVYIPDGQTPDDYFGQVEVLSGGQTIATLNVQLTVWSFTLPRETHWKSYLETTRPQLSWAFGLSATDDAGLRQLEDRFFQMAHQHRVNFNPTAPIEEPTTIQQELGERYRSYLDGTAFTYRVGAGVGQSLAATSPGSSSEAGVKSWAQDTLAWWQAQRFSTKLVCYIWDEPEKEDFPAVNSLSTWVKSAVGGALPIYLTTDTPQYVKSGLVDIWGEVPGSQVAGRQAKGEQFWSVNQGYAGGPFVDTPGYSGRSQAWMAWRMKLDGWHFWNCCYWMDKYNLYDANGVRIPKSVLDAHPEQYLTDTWSDPLTFDQKTNPHQTDWIRLNGDGVLFYPGTPVGLQEPLSSFTLKSVRRGAQDYEYLWLLSQAGKPGDDVVAGITPGAYRWSQDPDAWDRARLELGQRLNAVSGGKDATPPAAPAGLTAIAGVQRIDLRWTAGKDTDLAGYGVYRADSASGPFTRVAALSRNQVTFGDTGLVGGSTYRYQVIAVDGAGNESSPSSTVSATAKADQSPLYTISGTVTLKGKGLAGVTVSTDGGRSDTTNAKGAYVLTNIPRGIHPVTAGKPGYTFSAAQQVTVGGSRKKVNFQAQRAQ